MHSSIEPTAAAGKIVFSGAALSVMGKILPSRFKRLMFVFSVLGYIDRAIEEDMALVRQLNGLLRMPKSPQVCQVSLQIKDAIWKGTGINFEYMDLHRPPEARTAGLSTDRDVMVSFFIEHCPKWLRYGDGKDDMRRDLNNLFKAVSDLTPTPA